jgi:hypothetical protein
MKKIRITKISEEAYSQKGFDQRGCYGTGCNDMCCVGGCDVDKEAYDIILKNRKIIEEELCIRIEDCFKKQWSGDKEYLGGNSIESQESESTMCIFHLKSRKGCILYKLVTEKKLPRRAIPTICRLYPLNWDNGKIYVDGEIEKVCNCLKDNKTTKTIIETQQKEMKDIFEMQIK